MEGAYEAAPPRKYSCPRTLHSDDLLIRIPPSLHEKTFQPRPSFL